MRGANAEAGQPGWGGGQLSNLFNKDLLKIDEFLFSLEEQLNYFHVVFPLRLFRHAGGTPTRYNDVG